MERIACCATLLSITLTPMIVAQSETRSPGEVRLGVQSVSMDGATSFGNAVGASTGSLRAAELLARTTNIGLLLRTQTMGFNSGGVSVGDVVVREARLLIGDLKFSVELGVLERSQPRDPAREKLRVGRAGIRSQWDIGGSRFAVSLNAGVHIANTSKGLEDPSLTYRGHDGEVLLLYKAPRRLPLFAAVGWRLQTFDDLPETPAEVTSQSGPVIAIGLRLGN